MVMVWRVGYLKCVAANKCMAVPITHLRCVAADSLSEPAATKWSRSIRDPQPMAMPCSTLILVLDGLFVKSLESVCSPAGGENDITHCQRARLITAWLTLSLTARPNRRVPRASSRIWVISAINSASITRHRHIKTAWVIRTRLLPALISARDGRPRHSFTVAWTGCLFRRTPEGTGRVRVSQELLRVLPCLLSFLHLVSTP